MTDWLRVCLVWAVKGVSFGTLGVLAAVVVGRLSRRAEREVRR